MSDRWQTFALRRDPSTPWSHGEVRQKVRDFESVLNAYYPTVTDMRMTPARRRLLRAASAWRYHAKAYARPVELNLLAAGLPLSASGDDRFLGAYQRYGSTYIVSRSIRAVPRNGPSSNRADEPLAIMRWPFARPRSVAIEHLDPQSAYGRWAHTYPPSPHNRLMEIEQETVLSLLPEVHATDRARRRLWQRPVPARTAGPRRDRDRPGPVAADARASERHDLPDCPSRHSRAAAAYDVDRSGGVRTGAWRCAGDRARP